MARYPEVLGLIQRGGEGRGVRVSPFPLKYVAMPKQMCPFWHVYFSLSTDWPWTPNTFCLMLACYFLSWGKNKHVTLGMRLLWKYKRKSKLVCWKWVHFQLSLPQNSEFQAKIFGLYEKNMDFHLKKKKVLLPAETWEMRTQWEHPTLILWDLKASLLKKTPPAEPPFRVKLDPKQL